MSEIAVRHTLTNIVSSVPESYIDLFKDEDGKPVFVPVSEAELDDLRRNAEIEMYGKPLGEEDSDKPTQANTKAEIVAYAEGQGIDVDTTATKGEILEAIAAQEGSK